MVLATGNLCLSAYREHGDKAMPAIDQEVLKQVEVIVVDDSDLNATVKQALNYMRECNDDRYEPE